MLYACGARFDEIWNVVHFAKIDEEINTAEKGEGRRPGEHSSHGL
jgi:hypothetical protein